MKSIVALLVFLFIALDCSAQILIGESLNRQIQFLKGERPSFKGEIIFADIQDTVYNVTDADMPSNTSHKLTKSSDGYLKISMTRDYATFNEAKSDMAVLIDAVKRSYPDLILVTDNGNRDKGRPTDYISYLSRNGGHIFTCSFGIQKSTTDHQFRLSSELKHSWKPVK